MIEMRLFKEVGKPGRGHRRKAGKYGRYAGGPGSVLFGLLLLLVTIMGGCSGHRGLPEGKDAGRAAQPQDSVKEPYWDGSSLVYESGTERQKEIRLPDGTGVVMHAGTVLRWGGGGSRELWIEGEAMFDVIADAGKPFIVHTAYLQIIVLGTKFRLDARAKEAGEEVDVLSGRLKVMKSYHSDSDNEPEIIQEGEMVMINRDIDLMEKEKMDGSELKGWNGGN
jgi:ferric-dicitrate binding protein FerR (iron transport regulator)